MNLVRKLDAAPALIQWIVATSFVGAIPAAIVTNPLLVLILVLQ